MNDIKLLPGAEPFYFPGGPIGCLCLHGLTAAPHEVFWLGQHLAKLGATVYGPRMHGHGVNRSYLRKTRWQDWYLSALDGYHLLRAQCDQIFVLGLSMGSLISLRLAASEDVAGVVAMAVPLSLPIRGLRLMHLLRYVFPYLPPYDPDASPIHERIKQIQRERGERVTGRVSYWQFSTVSLSELLKLQNEVSAALSRIEAPVLLIFSEKDQTVPFANAELVKQGLTRSRSVQLVRLKESDHIIPADVENEQAFEAAWSFVAQNAHPADSKMP